MIDFPLFLTAVIGCTLAGALIGWDAAVHNHRRHRKQLEKEINKLEADILELRAEAEIDPQRAWINNGKRHIIYQFEALLHNLREAMEPRGRP